MIHLTGLPLPCPLNALYRAVPIRIGKGPRARVVHKQVLSKRARECKNRLVFAIWQKLGGRPQALTGDVQVTYTVTPRDRRTPDVDAFEKHLLDCMQHAGIYANDKQVVQVSKERLAPSSPGHLDVQVWEVAP